LSYSFRATGGGGGDCVIIAATDSPLTDIPNAGSADWNYYEI
jgi:mevalonate kinase